MGPLFQYLGGMVVDPDGKLIVGSEAAGPTRALFRVDPVTGDREILPDADIIGFGLDWLSPGKLVMTPVGFDGTLRVYDMATGQYSILSGAGVGSGPTLTFPIGVLVYVPEPSTLVMAGIGALGLALALRRRARRKV